MMKVNPVLSWRSTIPRGVGVMVYLFLNRSIGFSRGQRYLAISSDMVAVGGCSWKRYSSFMLSHILLIGIFWCGAAFISSDGSWGFHRGSDIASMRDSFFGGFLGILGTSEV